MARRLSTHTLEVLATFLATPSDSQYGLDIAERLSIQSGTLYPILGRLERDGWLSSEREDVDPAEVGRPRRRLYRLTGAGEAAASQALADHRMRVGAGAANRRRPMPRGAFT
jgi:PadR family transcriptional regulator PadR